MARINFANRTLTCKLVYYGPGLAGKTTNLEVIYAQAPADRRGELTAIATEGDRTIFFDFLPLELGKVGGLQVTQQLFTVPGQSYYAATRKLVLTGVDGVIFVADSQLSRLQENVASYEELLDQLKEIGKDPSRIPLVYQYNKRDLPDAVDVRELDRILNPMGAPAFESVASKGKGVVKALKAISRMVLERCREKYASSEIKAPLPQAPLGLETRTMTKILDEAQRSSWESWADLEPTEAPQDADSTVQWDEVPLPQVSPEHRIGESIGGCVIVAKLGEGGMGTAYLARRRSNPKETVVVKTLKSGREATERRVRRFFREARSAARLDHENVVQVREVGTDERGLHYMIMQHVSGGNLKEHVLKRGPLEPFEAARIVLEVARGLEATHRAGVIHRDVKPDNVVVGESGDVKLIDFGLSRDMHWEDDKIRPGGVVGTIMYMAPERFVGREADARSDIFSLGLTLYFLITGQLPFVRCKANEVIAGLARLRPPHAYIDEFPDRIRRVMEKMLAREPAARYSGAAALIKDLEALWSKKGPAAPPCGRLWLWDEDPSEMGALETMSHWSRPPSRSESFASDEPVIQFSKASPHYESEVVAALDEWDTLPEAVAAEGSSEEISRLIDAAWDDDSPKAWGSAVRKDKVESGTKRPKKLMTESWRVDLRQALNSIEAAELAKHQRNRLSRDPGQAEVNALLKRGPARGATRRLKRPDLKGAIKKLSRSIDDHDDHPQPWTKRGIARARGGDLDGAVEDYSRALALDATYLPALANRASANFHLRRYGLCEEDCTRAIARAPRLAKAWLFRGISRAMLGRSGAREDMLRFLRLSPYSPYVRYIRALLREVEGA